MKGEAVGGSGPASTVFFVTSSRYHTVGHGAGPSEHAERGAGQVPVQTHLCLRNAGLPSPDPPNTTVLFEIELLDFLDSAESDKFCALSAVSSGAQMLAL